NYVLPTGLPDAPPICLTFDKNQNLLLGSGRITGETVGGGLWRSTDQGNNWSLVGTNLNGLDTLNVSSVITKNDTIFVGAMPGIFKSTDNGVNWILCGLNNINIWSLAINDNGHIFAGTYSKGIYLSTNNGDDWAEINQGLLDSSISSLTANAKGHVFAGTKQQGIFKSTDFGNHWMQINNGLTCTKILSIISNSHDQLYTGTDEDVFCSTDNGENWIKINSTELPYKVYTLAIDSCGFLYAGTDEGVFRSIKSTTQVKENDEVNLRSFSLSHNYPNPFNPVTNIEFRIAKFGFASLKVFNLLGEEVATVVSEELPPGTYKRQWDGSKFSSGVYFYRLQTKGFCETKKFVLIR
ncbi:MAG: T9SS type A sorting domain-containing protein, partial [Bacteroidota bacterium]|nr:T9SS type A sorting domain-containing protein [Bacteroidota bacterium]